METKTEYVTEDAPGQAQRRIFAVSIAAFNVATGTMGTTVCAFTVASEEEAIGKALRVAAEFYPKWIVKTSSVELTARDFPQLALDKLPEIGYHDGDARKCVNDWQGDDLPEVS